MRSAKNWVYSEGMRNIELKALLRDHAGAIRACDELGAVFQGDIQQTDTYFEVAEGRFKLRESEPGDDYLVFYRRPNVASAKGCDYEIAVVERTIKPVLCSALGKIAVVEKVRSLYLWKNVRIHLDSVSELGDYIEFEAVLSDEYDDEDGHNKLNILQEEFVILPEDVLTNSYLEMILARE